MDNAELAKLKRKLALLTYNINGGVACGFSAPAQRTVVSESMIVGAEEAILLMRDGLRWRAALGHKMLPPLVYQELQKLADETISALA